MVVEFAVALPVVVLLVALVLGVARVGGAQVRCIDAAAAGARAAARGEAPSVVRATVAAVAPTGRTRITGPAGGGRGRTVVVEVGERVAPLGWGVQVPVSARAVAAVELTGEGS